MMQWVIVGSVCETGDVAGMLWVLWMKWVMWHVVMGSVDKTSDVACRRGFCTQNRGCRGLLQVL